MPVIGAKGLLFGNLVFNHFQIFPFWERDEEGEGADSGHVQNEKN